MKDRDAISGSVLLLLSLAGIFFSLQQPKVATAGLSNGFYPAILFSVLGLCGLSMVFNGLRRSSRIALPGFAWGKIIPVTIICVIYAYLFEFLGFRITTLLFLLVTMLFLGERRPVYLISLPLASTFGIYWLFSAVFKIALP